MGDTRYISCPAEATSSEIHVDTSAIPAEVRDDLAAATLECFKAFIAIPGNIEWLREKSAARKAAASAAAK